MVVSIFNDVIGPVMRGASSSHCAAALRIGRLARDLMDGDLTDVLVEFDRGGSLPTTHETQGSDMGLFGGLLGWDAADERLPRSAAALRAAGITARIAIIDAHDPHPNTYRLTLRNARETRTLIAISTGGGMIEVIAIDGFAVSIGGDYFETLIFVKTDAPAIARAMAAGMTADEIAVHDSPAGQLVEVRAQAFVGDALLDGLRAIAPDLVTRRLAPVLPVLSRANVRVPFSTCAELLRHDAGQNRPLWQWAVEYERARGGLSEAEVLARMVDIVRVLRRSIAQGVAGTAYDDRVLGHQSGRFDALMREGRLLNGGALNRTVLYVSALMEVKSSMGVIVAAPTAGACAALPASCIAMAEEMRLDEDDMARALLAAGLIGVFITCQWTFAAEVGGCQAEGGSAAAMAAAALVTLGGGDTTQAVAASSLALQSMLGLICDPVAGRVEVPCLGKNVLAASHALSCANMALAGFDPVIPFDEVVEAARRVGNQMPRELRCTSLGGLAATPTAMKIQGRLAQRLEKVKGPR
jgi:L-serine dehydratase